MANEPPEIVALSGQKIPRRISVEEISFAAHVDYTHNSKFIEMIDANYIVLQSDVVNLDSCPWRITSNGAVEKCVAE
jgi:Cft2 family RNA processing exonuclease